MIKSVVSSSTLVCGPASCTAAATTSRIPAHAANTAARERTRVSCRRRSSTVMCEMLVAGRGVIAQAARGAVALLGHAREDIVRIVALQDARHTVTGEQQQIEQRLQEAERGVAAGPPAD